MDTPKARIDRIRIFDGVNGKYSVFITDTKRIFSIGEKEKRVLDLLDGKNSLDTIQRDSRMSLQDVCELMAIFREAA